MAEGEQKLDFDDLMVQCKRLFLERPEVLLRLAAEISVYPD